MVSRRFFPSTNPLGQRCNIPTVGQFRAFLGMDAHRSLQGFHLNPMGAMIKLPVVDWALLNITHIVYMSLPDTMVHSTRISRLSDSPQKNVRYDVIILYSLHLFSHTMKPPRLPPHMGLSEIGIPQTIGFPFFSHDQMWTILGSQ